MKKDTKVDVFFYTKILFIGMGMLTKKQLSIYNSNSVNNIYHFESTDRQNKL